MDTYEALVNETIVANKQRSYDDWLKSDSGDPTGIIFLIPNTLWVVAGRNKLRWDNELADELEQHLITALSAYDSENFLEKAGIRNPTLREEIAALTQGFPIYLDLCMDVYERYKQRNNGNEPSISDFGDSRQKVVDRLIKYMDAPLQDMVKFLCALNYWIDVIAYELGCKILPNFSHTLYEQVKHFSFIQPDNLQVEDFSSDIFVFDKTVYNVLFSEANRIVLREILEGGKKYFSEKFKNLKEINGEYIFYANFFANLFVRLIDDSNELRKIFNDINWYGLIEWAKYDAAEHIIKLFFEKTTSLDGNAGENCAYFQSRLAGAQGLFLEALELNESALHILIAENSPNDPDVLSAKNDLAGTLSHLGRYDEALKLQEEVFVLRQEILGEKHPDTLVAMNNLAGTLTELGRYKESLKLQEEFLDLSKEIFGVKHPKTITAMSNLAVTLNDIRTLDDLAESNDKALKLQREVLKLRKETFGVKHPDTLTAMSNLAITLNNFGGYDEALQLQQKVLALRKEIFGVKHPDTLLAMNNLACTLSDLGRYDEALELQEEVLTLSSEILGEQHPNTISAKSNFAATLRDLGRCDKALNLQEEVLELRKKLLGEKHLDTIYAKSELAVTLSKLQRYDEALKLQEEVFVLRQKILGEHHPATARAIEDLIDIFTELENFDEVIKLMEKLSDAFGAGVGDEQIEISLPRYGYDKR